jgi:cell shape-determining protein MreD
MRGLGFSAPSRNALRGWGFALAVASVILPALPLGPLFQQPPMPLAVLWAAYGWAAEDESGWRAPTALLVLGLVHDQLAGGPFGLMTALYLFAYLIGRVAAVVMSAPNLVSLWGGFIVTALCTVLIARVLAPWALGPNVSIRPYAEACAYTALLFPLVRPLYMSGASAVRSQRPRGVGFRPSGLRR